MFDLHDNTRRWVCRTGFFALALVPTLSVLAWTASHYLPGVVEHHQQQLSNRLGLQVEIASVSHPRPGQTLYESLRLVDPDSDRVVFQCRTLEIGDQDNNLVLVASEPEMNVAGLAHVWRLIANKLRTLSLDKRPTLRFFAQQLTLHGKDQAQTITDLMGQIAPVTRSPAGETAASDANDVQATLRYHVAGTTSSQPAWITVGRKVSGGTAVTHLNLNTQETQLPLALLRSLLPAVANLGEEALFRGSIWAEETSAGWRGELAGELTHIDLNRLVTENFPHKLSGTATVTIDDARFEQGRLLRATGTLAAGPGVVETSLLASASQWLGLKSAPLGDRHLIRYDRLAARFQVDAGSLRIQPDRSHLGDGAIISAAHGPLLRQESNQPQPLLGLVRMLVPQSEVHVPATRETDWLLGHLPLPKVVEPGGDRSALPRGRLRFDDRSGGK